MAQLSDAEIVGKLRVLLGVDSSSVPGEVDKIGKDLEKRLGKYADRAGKSIGLAIGGAVVAFGALVKISLDTIDAQSKLAARTGSSIAAIQALTMAGDLADVSQEALAKSVGMLNVKLAEAARTAQGPAYEALRRLGLQAGELSKLDADERLIVIADRMAKLGLSAGQSGEVLRNLGIRSQEMANLLEGGGDAIREARQEIKELNIALGDVDGKKVEMANDAWVRVRKVLTGVGNQVAAELAGPLKFLADEFVEVAKQSGGIRPIVRAVVESVLTGVGSIIDSLRGWGFWIEKVQSHWKEFKADLNVKVGTGMFAELRKNAEEHAKRMADIQRREGEGPSYKPWVDKALAAMDAIDKKAKEQAEEGKKRREKPAANLDAFTTEERKGLMDRLNALKQSVSNEFVVLQYQRDKKLADLKELNAKLQLGAQEHNALKLQIEQDYQKQSAELIQSRLEEGTLTEQEALSRRYAQQLAMLEAFKQSEAYTVEKYEALKKRIVEANAMAEHQIRARTWSAGADIVENAMGHITSLMDSESSAQFNIMKGVAMAVALVKGYEAVVSAIAAGNAIGGPPVGAAFGAVAAAGVAAQIAKIAMTQPGSKGTVGGPSGGEGGGGAAAAAAAEPAASPAGPIRSSEISITGVGVGDIFTGKQLRQLIKGINEQAGDGVLIHAR